MTEYDLAQRERIRETLLSYMKEHKIGVPRLAARIKEAVYRNPEIPVKTLQRFLKGEVRTIDMHVGFLAQFIERTSNDDTTPRLGYALRAFYSSNDSKDWSGVFNVVEVVPGFSMEDRPEHYKSRIEFSRDQGIWRVKEITSDQTPHRVYDGAMTSSGATVVIVLKDRLNGLPRLITACSLVKDALSGVVSAAHIPRHLTLTLSPFAVETRLAQVTLKR